jgi:hypothetical protein
LAPHSTEKSACMKKLYAADFDACRVSSARNVWTDTQKKLIRARNETMTVQGATELHATGTEKVPAAKSMRKGTL